MHDRPGLHLCRAPHTVKSNYLTAKPQYQPNSDMPPRKRALSQPPFEFSSFESESQSHDLSPNHPPRKATCRRGAPPQLPPTTNSLIISVTQYGILECLARNLTAKDLFSLALTSRLAYQSIMHSDKSRRNLTERSVCDGSGLRIRKAHHRKARNMDSEGLVEYSMCGSKLPGTPVISKPCVSCGVNTCDECRIHCVYQTSHFPAEAEDELPFFHGYALLAPYQMGILSPEHLQEPALWHIPEPGGKIAHHDDGYLDIPIESETHESPQNIVDIIGFNLGLGVLDIGQPGSGLENSSQILEPFTQVSEARKRLMCAECFDFHCTGIASESEWCRCSLKNRFLDRWLCLHCFSKESEHCKKFEMGVKKGTQKISHSKWRCSCGKNLTGNPESHETVLCLWCKKAIRDYDFLSFHKFEYDETVRKLKEQWKEGDLESIPSFQDFIESDEVADWLT